MSWENFERSFEDVMGISVVYFIFIIAIVIAVGGFIFISGFLNDELLDKVRENTDHSFCERRDKEIYCCDTQNEVVVECFRYQRIVHDGETYFYRENGGIEK